MSTDNIESPQPSFGRRLLLAFKRIFIFLFRLLIILLIIGAVGAAVYYGAPVLINEYLLADVHTNTARIQEIDQALERSDQIYNQRIADLQNRLETLELQNDTSKQTIQDLRTRFEAVESVIQEQGTALEKMEPIQAALDENQILLSSLEEKVLAFETNLNDLQASILALSISIEGNSLEIEATKAELENLNARLAARDIVGDLRHELELLKVMELITRARVSIGDENIGLAKDDLVAAQEILARLKAEVSIEKASYLTEISQRLDLASSNLKEKPDLANEDLEVAWQMLLQGLPDEPAADVGVSDLTPTPTPGEGEGATPTPTPKP